jgi:hypothetical protein
MIAPLPDKITTEQSVYGYCSIQTNRFVSGEFYSNAATFGIAPTQDSLHLIRDALRGGSLDRRLSLVSCL